MMSIHVYWYIFFCFAAFSLTLDGDTGYCGYGDGNTAYRISVAGVTFLFGVLYFFEVIENHTRAAHWTLFVLTMMWFCVTVVDVYAIINGQQGCKDGFTSSTGSIDCDNSIYGKVLRFFIISIVNYYVDVRRFDLCNWFWSQRSDAILVDLRWIS